MADVRSFPHPDRPPGSDLQPVFERAAAAASLFVVAVSLTALLGWALETRAERLPAGLAALGTLRPGTAAGLLLLGLALWLLRSERSPRTWRTAAGKVMAGAAATFGLVVLARTLGLLDGTVDRLLLQSGRPQVTTAVGFVTTGLALVLLDAGGRAGVRPAQILALVPAILATEALAMYGYGRAERSFADEPLTAAFTPMALVTAVCLLALSFGILFARPGRGFMLLFLGGDFGALIARRLLPAAVIVPLVLGWLRLAGERAGLYGSATGVALFAVGTMVVFTILIGWSAAAVRRLDQARARAESALRTSEARYRALVETAYEGIWVVDGHGRTDFVNRRMSEMLGYSVDEMARRRMTDFVAPGEREYLLRLIARRMGGVEEVRELPLLRKDGSTAWALISISPIEEQGNGSGGAFAMVTDITERKHATDRLRESEERFRSIFERAGIGIVLADVEGRFLMTNPAIQRFLGYSAAELERFRFTEITHPGDADLDWGLYEELLSGARDLYQIEKRYIRKDGTIVWGRLTVSRVRERGEGDVLALGMVEDITARKVLEEERSRLSAILETTPDFVGIADSDGRIQSLNAAARAMVGISEGDDVRQYQVADLHPSHASAVILGEGIPLAVKEGVWSGETAVLTRDGREIPVSQVIIAHRGKSGEVEFFSTIIRNISDRIRRQENEGFLLEASRLLTASLEEELVLKGVAELVAESRADYCLIERIDSGTRIYSPIAAHRDPEGQRLLEALSYTVREPGRCLGSASVFETRKASRLVEVNDAWLIANAASDAHLELLRQLDIRSQIVVPVVIHENLIGTITCGRTGSEDPFTPEDVAVAEELAARTGVAVENCRLYVESRQATHTRDEVLRIVAHDLRNPLSTIALAVGVVLEVLPESMSAARHQLEIAERSVELSNRLIQDLLDVARMQASKLSMEPALINAREVAEEAVALHRSLAAEKSLQLDAELGVELPPIMADRGRILQVFSNLIGNAIKFTPAGGRVTIRGERADDSVRFSVSDTGEGISESDRDKLFDPFWQARPGGLGAGLGLPLAKGIVEAHGGRMEVVSDRGGGSTFSFTVPAVLVGVQAAP